MNIFGFDIQAVFVQSTWRTVMLLREDCYGNSLKKGVERKRANARFQHRGNDFQFIWDNTIKKTIELGFEALVKQSLLLFRDLCENVNSMS